MALDIDYFRAIQGGIGHTNAKEVTVAEVRKQFADDFDSSIGVAYGVTRNGVSQDFIITPTKEKNKCNIYTRPNEELNIGDIIFWNKLHWLVVDKDFQNDIYNIGTIVRCNRIVRWQNPITLEIIERWCFCSKPYTSNISEGSVVSTLKGKYDIQLSYDAETIQVGIDKRLMLDIVGGNPMVYKLTFPDANTNKYQDIEGGFIEWTVVSDEYIPDKDNVELMICDYIAPPENPDVSSTPLFSDNSDDLNKSLLKCEIVGRKDILVGGSAREYVAVFYDTEGTKVSTENISPKWEIILPEGYQNSFETNFLDNGFTLRIRVLNNNDLAGMEVTLKMKDENNKYNTSELTIGVISNI